MVTKKQIEEFRVSANPLMNWLHENFHPHMLVIVTSTGAEITEALAGVRRGSGEDK